MAETTGAIEDRPVTVTTAETAKPEADAIATATAETPVGATAEATVVTGATETTAKPVKESPIAAAAKKAGEEFRSNPGLVADSQSSPLKGEPQPILQPDQNPFMVDPANPKLANPRLGPKNTATALEAAAAELKKSGTTLTSRGVNVDSDLYNTTVAGLREKGPEPTLTSKDVHVRPDLFSSTVKDIRERIEHGNVPAEVIGTKTIDTAAETTTLTGQPTAEVPTEAEAEAIRLEIAATTEDTTPTLDATQVVDTATPLISRLQGDKIDAGPAYDAVRQARNSTKAISPFYRFRLWMAEKFGGLKPEPVANAGPEPTSEPMSGVLRPEKDQDVAEALAKVPRGYQAKTDTTGAMQAAVRSAQGFLNKDRDRAAEPAA